MLQLLHRDNTPDQRWNPPSRSRVCPTVGPSFALSHLHRLLSQKHSSVSTPGSSQIAELFSLSEKAWLCALWSNLISAAHFCRLICSWLPKAAARRWEVGQRLDSKLKSCPITLWDHQLQSKETSFFYTTLTLKSWTIIDLGKLFLVICA